MKILSIIGPLGSGKTTLTLKIFKELENLGFNTKKKFAYVVNDGYRDKEKGRRRQTASSGMDRQLRFLQNDVVAGTEFRRERKHFRTKHESSLTKKAPSAMAGL